jgi:hypothetical protein
VNTVDPSGQLTLAELDTLLAIENQLLALGTPALTTGYMVPRCTIVIFVGHNQTSAPHIPTPIKNDPCSAASVVACSGGAINVPREIPGIDPRPDGIIGIPEANKLAKSDLGVAQKYALEGLCRNNKCGCSSIAIKINCDGLSGFLERQAARICDQKEITIDCKRKACSGNDG